MSASQRTNRTDVHPVDARPALLRLIALGFQHVIVMYSGAIAAPLIVAAGLGFSPAEQAQLVSGSLLICGIGTLLQSVGIWKFGIRLPLVMGCAFNAVSPMVLIGTKTDIPTMYGAVIFAGVGMILLAPVYTRFLRFFPPVVIGTTITIIGLALLPAGLQLVTGSEHGSSGLTAGSAIALATVTIALVILCFRVLPTALGQASVLIAMVLATVIAALFGAVDFSSVAHGAAFQVPQPFPFGAPRFDPISSLSMLVIMFVLMIEGSGQMIAVGREVDRHADEAAIARGLRAEGVTTALGGIFGTIAYTTFAQNIGILSLTKVRSRHVVSTAGLMLVLLGLFPPVGRLVAAIPQPVLGGAALVMFAMVAVAGLRLLAAVDFGSTANSVIVAVSLAIGLIPAINDDFYQVFPQEAQMFLGSGVATGSLAAVALNLIFNGARRWSPSTHVEQQAPE